MATAQTSGLSPRQLRLLRALTLVCFFHFSGLNNGFAYFAESANFSEPAGFAPVAIHSVVFMVNPFAWRKAFYVRAFIQPVYSSQRILEAASQKALKDMRVWMHRRVNIKTRVQISSNKKISKPISPSFSNINAAGQYASWLKAERMDILNVRSRNWTPHFPGKIQMQFDDTIKAHLKSGKLFSGNIIRAKRMPRIHYDGEDSPLRVHSLVPAQISTSFLTTPRQ